MGYRLAYRCRNFLLRNRFACFCCALAVLNLLILLSVWQILKPKAPAVYGIVELGDDDITAEQLKRRTDLLLFSRVLTNAAIDLAAAGYLTETNADKYLEYARKDPAAGGQTSRKPDATRWLKERLWLEPLEKSARVRVGFEEGTPTEQAVIINAVLRAYLRHFEKEEERLLEGKLAQDRGRITKELAPDIKRIAKEFPKLGREEYNRQINQLIGDRFDRLKAARRQEIRAAMGTLPVVVEWAQTP